MSFYNPFEGQDSGQFTGWKNGTNNVAIVAVSELSGDRLSNKLRWLSEASDCKTVFNKLDINLVITIAKENYEYNKEITFAFAFEYNADGSLNKQSKTGMLQLRRAYDMFNMLFTKPPLGLNQFGNIITEQGKVITNLASYLQTSVNKDRYDYFAYMVKGAKYWDCKLLSHSSPDAVKCYEKQALYWNGRAGQEQPKEPDTSFNFGNNKEDDNPFMSK